MFLRIYISSYMFIYMYIDPCAYHAFKHLFAIQGDRYIHMHTEGKRKRKVIAHKVQMTDISLKSIDRSPS